MSGVQRMIEQIKALVTGAQPSMKEMLRQDPQKRDDMRRELEARRKVARNEAWYEAQAEFYRQPERRVDGTR